jgi:glycosyltransferase involved in cell wall biosynthesis
MNELKICILGNYEGRLDEGMGNVSYHIYQNIKMIFPNCLYLNINNMYTLNFWGSLIKMKPHIIHMIPGPTIKLLILLKIIKLITNCKTVVSATKTSLNKSFKKFAKFLQPNYVIVNSEKSENIFKQFGYRTKFLPNGVNIEKFCPINQDEKRKLRNKFGINENKFVILHVGPLIKGRNQRCLLEIPDVTVLLILSLTNISDNDEIKKLSSKNIIICKKFLPNIEEAYQLSDLYVFPIFENFHSIEIPLSVLEAMACNLPVITSRYGGGLERLFKEGNGLKFAQSSDEIKKFVLEIKQKNIDIKTRDKIELFTWKHVCEKIANIYNELNQK